MTLDNYEEALKHFHDIGFLNETAMKEYIKLISQENSQLKQDKIDLEFRIKSKK